VLYYAKDKITLMASGVWFKAGNENNNRYGYYNSVILTGAGSTGFLGINDNIAISWINGAWTGGSHTFTDSYGLEVRVTPNISPDQANPRVLSISIESQSPGGTFRSSIISLGLTAGIDPWNQVIYRNDGISLDTYRQLVGSDTNMRQRALELILSEPKNSLTTSNFNSYIRGGPKDDRLTGYAGNDQIYGGYGDDIIIGSRDASQNLIGELIGEQGDDTIYAKSNNVVKTSWSGHESSELDTVVFSAKSRGIRIRDFDPEHVSIIIDGKTSRKKISFREGTFSSNGRENNGQYLMIKNKPAAFLDYASRFTEKQLLKSVSSLDLRLETLSIDDSFSALIGLNS
jgi:hypothetical protein